MAIILVIEDNPGHARLIKRVLSYNDHKVIVMHDGIGGLAAAIKHEPDLVLLDIGLPDVQGTSVAAIIRRLRLTQAPIVAISVEDSDNARELAEFSGCDGFISKPIDTRDFPAQIEIYLHNGPEESAAEDDESPAPAEQ